ncbi:uncharacterized protein N7458_012137 [Penicillium daleae]|uniref:SUN domain-containing protein n=1 Tax=Penicillium daleae TaxID=63821 RepID=A0AAD6BTM4_9EURO|nr:uncharacterized protein N7458_012137 [Penicillium daleae]KAJ5432981.1 hypothetical protein N7458_012137 [Penicillium daleae]
MAPKGTRRRQKGYASEPEDEESVENLLDFVPGPTLPAVPIANSWNYGATSGTGLPRKMALQPALDANRMAKRINAGLDMAEKRSVSPPSRKISNGNLEPLGTRYRKTAAKNPGPVPRKTKRQPTPDQTQLTHTLHDATTSPPGSDVTLSPPVAQTVSTDSSSPVDPPLPRRLSGSSNEPLYPSPLKRRGNRNTDAIVRSTPDRQSSVDNASEVSWNLERDIHEDDLQRTRPSKYRGEPHGQNITKPPRRPSGLSMIQDTILEEEEEQSELLSQPPRKIQPVFETEAVPPSVEWDAPVRTIIPQEYESRPISAGSTAGSRRESLAQQIWTAMSSQQPGSRTNIPFTPKRRIKWLRVILILFLPLALVYAFLYQDEILQNLQTDALTRIRWCVPFGRSPIDFSSNGTDSAAFHGLQYKVKNMNSQVSSLSREIGSLRSELAQSPRTTAIIDPGRPTKPVPRINFLSPALGALVDPSVERTSPTAGQKLSRPQKAFQWVFGTQYGVRTPPPPVTALEPWSDAGDCWCGTPRDGVTQLSVVLQHPIVPEEFVVEHIPFGTTLDPYAAPKDIEVWAHYGVFPSSKLKVEEESEPSLTWSHLNPWRSEAREAKESGLTKADNTVPVTKDTLPLVVMSTLRIANKGVPESEYSNDLTLGRDFYRIGKMRYDIYGEDNVQRFQFDGIIEIPHLRVDQLTFRMTSNWGSNRTCIYRFKLHGHL